MQSNPIEDVASRRLRSRLRHFDGPGDVGEFLAIGTALAIAPVALSRLKLPQLLALLDAPSAPHTANDRDLSSERGARAARLALYADYWLGRLRPGNPCLRRSLALFWRLRRAGLPVAFCLGVRSDQALAADEPAAGHAWLELDGVAILESETTVAHYATTFRYPLDRGS
jgi:hypothetical protein